MDPKRKGGKDVSRSKHRGVSFSHLSAHRQGCPKPVERSEGRARFSSEDPCEGTPYECAQVKRLEDLLPEGAVELVEVTIST